MFERDIRVGEHHFIDRVQLQPVDEVFFRNDWNAFLVEIAGECPGISAVLDVRNLGRSDCHDLDVRIVAIAAVEDMEVPACCPHQDNSFLGISFFHWRMVSYPKCLISFGKPRLDLLSSIRPILPLVLLVPAVSIADPAQEVRCSETGFSVAAEHRDADAFAAYIDADARFIGATVARGVEEIVAAWQPFLTEGGPAIKWRSEFVEVLQEGDLALSRGPYRLTVIDEHGNTSEHWGTFNSVWRLHDDGAWRVVFDAGSPATETPTDEQRALLDSETDDCPGIRIAFGGAMNGASNGNDPSFNIRFTTRVE